jgi:hypothetical protein
VLMRDLVKAVYGFRNASLEALFRICIGSERKIWLDPPDQGRS